MLTYLRLEPKVGHQCHGARPVRDAHAASAFVISRILALAAYVVACGVNACVVVTIVATSAAWMVRAVPPNWAPVGLGAVVWRALRSTQVHSR